MFRSNSTSLKLIHQKCFSTNSKLLSAQQFKVRSNFIFAFLTLLISKLGQLKKKLFLCKKLIIFHLFDFPIKKAKLTSDEIDGIHKTNLNPVLKTLYRRPLIIKNGFMQYVYDNEDRKYLDMFAGIVTTSVGHCHPVLVEKFKSQAEKLWHVSSLYNAEETHEYAQKLASKFPSRLNNIFLCNSGEFGNEMMKK